LVSYNRFPTNVQRILTILRDPVTHIAQPLFILLLRLLCGDILKLGLSNVAVLHDVVCDSGGECARDPVSTFQRAGSAGAGGVTAAQVGKLEKGRGVGFGEAPLDARPPDSVHPRTAPAG
jgi:hypothetical protein